ncbi:MAG: SDR family NAD(P)-dependent oxidoreductase [Hyphomicrobiales bacterium]
MKTALITGGARGIGSAIASNLHQQGLNLVLWGRDEGALNDARTSLRHGTGSVHCFKVDVGDSASIVDGLDDLAAQNIDIDVLVNNAGILTDQPLLTLDEADILAHMAVNAIGPLRLIRALAPGMAERGYGRIANLSSGWGSFEEGLGPGAYGISKALLNAITVKIAGELPRHVKVNAACPGWVRTQMGGSGANRSIEEGAETPTWLATLPDNGPTGGFFRDKQPISW